MTKRCALVMASAFCLAVGVARPALAHAILTDSLPRPDGTLASGHRILRFDYNSRIDHKRSRLTLTGPDGKRVVLVIRPDSAANALDADADLAAGAYSLRWQALAIDGHITRGDVPFTVSRPSSPASSPASH